MLQQVFLLVMLVHVKQTLPHVVHMIHHRCHTDRFSRLITNCLIPPVSHTHGTPSKLARTRRLSGKA